MNQLHAAKRVLRESCREAERDGMQRDPFVPLSGVPDGELEWLRRNLALSVDWDLNRLRNAFRKRHSSREWRSIAVFAAHSLRCQRSRVAAVDREILRRADQRANR